MTRIRTYRDLVAWQKGMDVARRLYAITRDMPPEERFGLTSQMRRAAVSIPSNIAEGYGRQTRPDYLKHLRIARGSLVELETQVTLASDLSMLRDTSEIQALIAETDRVLQALIMSLERKTRQERKSSKSRNK